MSTTLSSDDCYRALQARDRRFDGVFFVGVTSTRIYCRPICTVRVPRKEHCRFFGHPALAEHAGFRPCLRCRPELAPGTSAMEAVDELTRAAVARIEAGALTDGARLEGLADELGVTARHLRRSMQRVLGVSPVQLAQTHRLLSAKRLLTETRLPVIEVAFASGFRSVRRFNALFRERYGFPPTRLRAGRTAREAVLRLSLPYRPPLAWAEMLRHFAVRRVAGVERVDGASYARAMALRGHRGWVLVQHDARRNALAIEVAPTLAPVLPEVLAALRRAFDLDARPDVIAAHLRVDSLLRPLVARRPGLRVPGTVDGFEASVRTIIGQQVSVAAATTVMGRLCAEFCESIETPFSEVTRLPITPAALASSRVATLARLGLNARRAETLRALARAVASGDVVLHPGARPLAEIARLRALPGIGPWTASYLAMRVLRWPDAFPAGDLGIRKALGHISERAAETRSEAWRPWRAYAAQHLWQSLLQ